MEYTNEQAGEDQLDLLKIVLLFYQKDGSLFHLYWYSQLLVLCTIITTKKNFKQIQPY